MKCCIHQGRYGLLRQNRSSDKEIQCFFFVSFNYIIIIYDVASESEITSFITCLEFIASTIYLVKLPLALSNNFYWTESIMTQSHDDAKNPYWGLNMDFWHCLIVMTYRNRALFRLELGKATRFNMAE